MTRWWKTASVLLAAGTMAGGVPSFPPEEPGVVAPQREANSKVARAVDAPVLEVKPDKLSLSVEEWGLLEATRNQDVYSRIEGQTDIISIVSEGTRVTKGQLVCELDGSALKDQLLNQEIAARGAEAAYQNARLTREVAEIGLAEYTQGTSKQEVENIRSAIGTARAKLQKARDRLDRNRSARKRMNEILAAQGGVRELSELLADLHLDDRLEANVELIAQHELELELAKLRQEVNEKYTQPKTVKELEAGIEKAKSDELAKQQTWELEKIKEAKLERLIKNCKLLAPGDGVVVYANDPDRFGVSSQPRIEEGARVRERQKIFSISDLSGPMRVNVKVPESIIEWLTPGLQARIQVDGFADENLPGMVESIAPLPDPSSSFNRDTKVYSTYVAIAKGPEGLTPGMAARVKVLTTELDNVLSVPVPAVVYYDRKDHVAVQKPDGGFDWRSVNLGLSTGVMVEVKQGLKSGETVALEPAALLSGGQKLKISLSPPKPAPKPKSKPATKRVQSR